VPAGVFLPRLQRGARGNGRDRRVTDGFHRAISRSCPAPALQFGARPQKNPHRCR
jgi:hypothetical protein